MIITALNGAVAVNPHTEHYLLLSCPTVPDTLALAEFTGDQPYQRWREGWDSSDGRSLNGAIRIKGQNRTLKSRWALNFLLSSLGLTAFEQMLEAQRQGQIAQILDAWDAPGAYACFLEVGDRYRTLVATDWWAVQLSAMEV